MPPGGGRFKKQKRKKCRILAQDEIKFLAENTNFENKTIVDWHKVHPADLVLLLLLFIILGVLPQDTIPLLWECSQNNGIVPLGVLPNLEKTDTGT